MRPTSSCCPDYSCMLPYMNPFISHNQYWTLRASRNVSQSCLVTVLTHEWVHIYCGTQDGNCFWSKSLSTRYADHHSVGQLLNGCFPSDQLSSVGSRLNTLHSRADFGSDGLDGLRSSTTAVLCSTEGLPFVVCNSVCSLLAAPWVAGVLQYIK